MVQQRAGGKRTRAGNPSAHERGSNTGRAYEDVCIEVGGVLRAELCTILLRESLSSVTQSNKLQMLPCRFSGRKHP